MKLRPYQLAGVDALRRAYRRGRQRVLYTLPTGGGKTVLFSFITRSASERGRRTMIVVHRKELLDQVSRTLTECGVGHGIIHGAHAPTDHLVQVGTVQTIARRLHRIEAPELVIYDEAHHCVAGQWQKTQEAWPESQVLGVTATPIRLDGRGLGDVYEELVIGPTTEQLTAAGFLAPAVVYAPQLKFTLDGVATRGGDYAKAQLAAALDTPTITGDALAHYRRLCGGRRAIAFCCSIDHARNVSRAFAEDGIRAGTVHGKLSTEDRRAVLRAFASGHTLLLAACDLISEGFDVPDVGATIHLRPTKSMGLHRQQVGRALRPSALYPDAIILDHANNTLRFGLPDDDPSWTLKRSKDKKSREDIPAVRQCPGCFLCHRPRPKCPRCGYVYPVKPREVAVEAGELSLVDKITDSDEREAAEANCRTIEDYQEFGRRQGYDGRWAYLAYRRRRLPRAKLAEAVI